MWPSTDVLTDVWHSAILGLHPTPSDSIGVHPAMRELRDVSTCFNMFQHVSTRYGTLPVVHATGGLVDSVKDRNSTHEAFELMRTVTILDFAATGQDVSLGVETATGFLVPWP